MDAWTIVGFLGSIAALIGAECWGYHKGFKAGQSAEARLRAGSEGR